MTNASENAYYNVPQFWFAAELNKAKEFLKSHSFESAKQHTFQHAVDSLKGTSTEFFFAFEGKRSPVVPFNLEIKTNQKGEPHLFGYGDWYVDAVKSEEHCGVTKQTAQQIEQLLLSADIGSIACYTSPAGPAEMNDEHGRPITYQDTATYVLQKISATEIKAFTVLSDMSLLEAERFQRAIHPHFTPDSTLPLEQRMQAIIHDPVLLPPDTTFDELLETIKSTMGTNTIRQGITFDSALHLIHHPEIIEKAWTDSERIQKLMTNFEQLISSCPDEVVFLSTLARELPKLVLDISASVRDIPEDQVNYAQEAEYVSQLDGCTTSGLTYSSGTLADRINQSILQNSERPKCPCGWEASDSQWSDIKAGMLRECPKCNWDPCIGYIDKNQPTPEKEIEITWITPKPPIEDDQPKITPPDFHPILFYIPGLNPFIPTDSELNLEYVAPIMNQ